MAGVFIPLLYLCTGACAGLLAGLFGVGGGVIVVPVLNFLFEYQHFPHEHTMHMAIGTSLAIMIFTAASAAYAYQQRKLIIWSLFYKIISGLVIGTMTGTFIAKQISSEQLRLAFAIFMILIALQMIFSKKTSPTQSHSPSFLLLLGFGFLIGVLSGFFGIGGGSLMVPFFVMCNIEMRKATGTSALCGLPLAIVGTISVMLTGWTSSFHMAVGTIGYVYWPAALLVATTSLVFAPLGTRLAVKLPSPLLKKLFAALLIATAFYLLIFSH